MKPLVDSTTLPGQERNAEPFKTGQLVRVPPVKLNGLLVAVARRVAGRVGTVEKCFKRLGASNFEVRVQWLRANRTSTMGKPEIWPPHLLEVAEGGSAPNRHDEPK